MLKFVMNLAIIYYSLKGKHVFSCWMCENKRQVVKSRSKSHSTMPGRLIQELLGYNSSGWKKVLQ